MPTRALLAIATILCSLAVQASAAQETDSKPVNAAALENEGLSAYSSGDFAAAAAAFVGAAEVRNGSEAATNLYNAGCCLARAGDTDAALAMLERAIDAGYANFGNMSGDGDLDSLRDDPRFDPLLESIAGSRIVITTNVKHDPDEAEFIFDDAHNFVRAMAMVADGAELIPTLESAYFGRATAGLKQMVVKYPFTAEGLAEAIERYPEKYARIADNITKLEARQDDFHAAFRRYHDIAPDTVFAPTYFLVDKHRGIGSGSPDGQLISIERRTEESIGRIETLLVHELVHFQQLRATGPDEFYALFGPKKSLLGLTIREGTAEFFADHATGRMTQQDAVEYCLANEEAVWERFQSRMLGDDTDGWMWSTPSDPDVPRDLGYVFGARIVKAYFDKANDKRQAVREILGAVDYEALLKKSGYGTQFE